ncbi:MAG: TolC family protein [Bacteroidales bacterium]|nr:MAG: TolC family protein [Bacteroidales bacterium]
MKIVLKFFFVLWIGLSPSLVFGQRVVNLLDLYKAVDSNNPLARIPSGIDSVYQLKHSNLKANYLPKLDVNGSATWQSDVTSLNVNLPIPGFTMPSADKDQYKVALDVSQLIWDGGTTKAKEDLESLNQTLEKNRVNIEIYSIKDRITNLFFNLLILRVTENQLNLMSADLDKRIQELESSVNSGYILGSTLDGLKAEKLKLLQNIDGVPAQRQSLISSLKSLTGITLHDNDIFILPNPDSLSEISCIRPEFEGFKYQQNVLNASSSLIARKRYPILVGFASAGYGKPGLNMLSNSWDTYYMLGAKLSWNIWDWNSVNKDKQQLKIQKNIVDYRKQAYLDGYQAQIDGILSEIQKLNNQLSKDHEIVKLLHQVTERSGSSLKNGTITSAVYLADFNSESRSKLELELRKIKLSLQKVLL